MLSDAGGFEMWTYTKQGARSSRCAVREYYVPFWTQRKAIVMYVLCNSGLIQFNVVVRGPFRYEAIPLENNRVHP